ncbi:MAG: serine/threonine-protein kinase [candidate division Zixibacteria bacterium]|nr:serine/threonine-protein kinase [candidate division Zixibacteria bacterium]
MEEQFIGSYRIIKKIGIGGMARVYLGVHRDIPNLKVVLKIVGDPRLVERFKQEADKLALLDGHPNICKIKHFFNHGDDFVIAMEYIEGIDLEERIKNEEKLPVAESLKIISDVLDILEFAHQKGIYHRDIKPGNIMIDNSGRVKIIDFGIAKAKTDPNLTIVGTACGTPAYMAPEQFVPSEQTDYVLVDIYAIGVTLYYMLTGRLPFEGDNPFAMRDIKLFNDPARPRELNPEIPKEVENIILKSMKREPSERFQTAAEMKTAIDCMNKNAGDITSSKQATDRTKSSPKPKFKKSLIILPLSIMAVIAVLIYQFYPAKSNKTVPPPSPPDTSQVNQEKAVATPETTAVIVSKPTGIIDISVEPFGDIYIDNNLLKGKANGAFFTSDTGRHIIRIKNGEAVKKEFIDTILLATGQRFQKQYSFIIVTPKIQTPSKPISNMGEIRVGSNPKGAFVFIDGEQQRHQTNFGFPV